VRPVPLYPGDVEHLLKLVEPTLADYRALWDLAATIALQLAPADLERRFGGWLKELIEGEKVGPLEALLGGLDRHGTPEQLAHLNLADLQPMLVSDHPQIKLLALDFIAALPALGEEQKGKPSS
jgi:hypothetical protein